MLDSEIEKSTQRSDLKESTFICAYCGEERLAEKRRYFTGVELCNLCYHDETIICSHCDERIWVEHNAGTQDTPLCQGCYEQHYTVCDYCSLIIPINDAYHVNNQSYCQYCYDNYCDDVLIRDYNYQPTPIFYGEGTRFYGVELEIDDGGKDYEHAKKIINIANKQLEHIYIKSDSSLHDGLEIVTHPMSLLYHLQQMPWSKVAICAINLGYLSHRTDSCGLHIHVNRSTFTDDVDKQDECIGRVLFFMERFWEELLCFSRRTEGQLKRWAARYGYRERPQEILDTAKMGYSGRYACVNIQNSSTIEFRIFRGTLKHNTIIATLQLVHEICNVASLLSDHELSALSWCAFVQQLEAAKYPELIQYLKERRLYVNEPIMYEEEN